MKNKNENCVLGMGARVEYKTQILENGVVVKDNPWKHNLILNQGLNRYGTDGIWAECFTFCKIGTGTTPVRRDSSPITFTGVGTTTITASAGFFEAADVGRIIKFNDLVGTGTELLISTFISATQITVASPWTGVFTGTIWYTSRTGLQTTVKDVNTYSTSPTTDCQTTYATGVYTHQRAFIFTAEVGTVTYTEAGWGWASGATNVFGMDLINNGVGDTLTAGQQYKVFVQLKIAVGPYSTPASLTTPIAGVAVNATAVKEATGSLTVNSTGIAMFIINPGVGTSISYSGSTGKHTVWDHVGQIGERTLNSTYGGNNPQLSTLSTALAPETGIIIGGLVVGQVFTETIAAYTTGTYTRTKTYVWNVANGNTTSMRSIILGTNSSAVTMFRWLFAANWTKLNTQTLTVNIIWRWGRTLVN